MKEVGYAYGPPTDDPVEPDYETSCDSCNLAQETSLGVSCEEAVCVCECHDTRMDADDAADRAYDEAEDS